MIIERMNDKISSRWVRDGEKLVGLFFEENGMYYFKPFSSVQAYTPAMLREIANDLATINGE